MELQETVIARLLTHHGWASDRLRKTVAYKDYESAVGLKRAVVWITYDAECKQFWMHGEFTSAGEDVLATCYSCISAAADQNTVSNAVDSFVADAERRIAGSYAVRLLRSQKAA